MNNFPILSGLNDHQLGALIVLALVAQVWNLVKLRSTDRNAKKAVDQTAGTGNGFANDVRGELAHIREEQAEQREQLKFANTYIQRLDQRQQAHLEYHVRENR